MCIAKIARRDFAMNWARTEGWNLSLAQNGVPNMLKRRRYIRKDCIIETCAEWLAGEPGFEPGLTESESAGLPLTYSPVERRHLRNCIGGVKRVGAISACSKNFIKIAAKQVTHV